MVNIKKKEIKGKIYYYLEHSYREKGRIKKKEKYLGTEIPKNIEEITAIFRSELEKNLYKKLELIKKDFQLEWKRIPDSVKQKQKEEASIAFTYNTNAIEGSTITLEETRGIIHDKIAPNKSLRDIRETEAHSKVFLKMLDKKEKVSKELLLKWHKEIFEETKSDIAGRYRDYLVRVGPHLAPDWQEIERLMNHLFKFLETNKKMNPVELAGRAHYNFEKIHPFGDGNGRIGRLLMNYILWHSGYPMLIIEYIKRKSYYKALQKNEEAFVSYFIKRYLAIHKSRLKLG